MLLLPKRKSHSLDFCVQNNIFHNIICLEIVNKCDETTLMSGDEVIRPHKSKILFKIWLNTNIEKWIRGPEGWKVFLIYIVVCSYVRALL